jgi:hypothetical protein
MHRLPGAAKLAPLHVDCTIAERQPHTGMLVAPKADAAVKQATFSSERQGSRKEIAAGT